MTKKSTQEQETKFCGMPAGLPKKVRVEIQTNFSHHKNGHKVNSPINREYFDIHKDCKTQDWAKLSLSEDKPIAQMFAGKKSNRGGSKKEDAIFFDNYPIKVRLATASTTNIYSGGCKESIQVEIPQGYIVPISTDVFFEALMRDGMDHVTKELNSEFIVVTLNKITRLVRVGSDLHNATLERIESDNKPKIDIKTMATGEVYETKAGSKALFLGFVTTKFLKVNVVRGPSYNPKEVETTYSTMKLGTLWLPLNWRYSPKSSVSLQKNFNENYGERVYQDVVLKTKSSHGYIKKSPNLFVNVPNEVIRDLRLSANKRINNRLSSFGGNEDCSILEEWIAKRSANGIIQPFVYPTGFQRQQHPIPFIPPSWYDLDGSIKGTKLANMQVFGMQPEASLVSKKLEKLILLYNKIGKLGLDPRR